MLSWAASMLSFNAIPPDPAVAGERWRELWLERIDSVDPYEHEWLRHQRRDDYWKQGSVCEDYAAIECPVYAIGGWADGYSEAVFRLVKGLGPPSKGLLGPWSHAFPDDVEPGPAIGFLQECLRWWDRWLKGVDTGMESEPILRAWMQEPVKPSARQVERPGRWVAEEGWPSPNVEERRLWLGDRTLREAPDGGDAGSRSAPTSCAGSTEASGAPTEPAERARWISAPTTAARSASTPTRSTSALSSLATYGWSSSWTATGRSRSSPPGSATWRPTAARCSSPAAC